MSTKSVQTRRGQSAALPNQFRGNSGLPVLATLPQVRIGSPTKAEPFRAFTAKAEMGRGLLVAPCCVMGPTGESVELHALWDTGCDHVMISREAASRLALKPILDTSGDVVLESRVGVNGSREVPSYIAHLILPNGVAYPDVVMMEGGSGHDVIIGLSVIATGDFAVSGFGDSVTFSFRYPSQNRIDFTPQAARKR